MELYEIYLTMKNEYASNIAYSYVDNSKVFEITYEQFAADLESFVAEFGKLNSFKGKKIGIIASNSYKYIVILIGIILSGGIAVPLNHQESDRDILLKLKSAEINSIFVDKTYDKLATYKKVCKTYSFDEVSINNPIVQENLLPDPHISIYDEVMMLFTSGTTGTEKCAIFLYNNIVYIQKEMGNLLNNLLSKGFINNYKDIDRWYMVTPIYHVFSIAFIFITMKVGFTLAIGSSAVHVKNDLKILKPKCMSAVPAIMDYICSLKEQDELNEYNSIKNVFCGGAPVSSQQIQRAKRLDINAVTVYGLTETLGVGTFNVGGNIRSVGTINDGLEVHIVDEEICLSGPALCNGYFGNKKLTDKIFNNGIFHTGDLGYVDDDGYLYLTGRKKNIIILSSGENVSPEELESIILENNSQILEAFVYQKNDMIVADLYCSDYSETLVSVMENYIKNINRSLPRYKKIQKVNLREKPIEKNAAGKIIRKI